MTTVLQTLSFSIAFNELHNLESLVRYYIDVTISQIYYSIQLAFN